MSAYLIVDAKITDPAKFMAYAVATSALVEQWGGKYLVQGGGEMECLEGTPFVGKAVISEWTNRAAALAFWHSQQYTEARKLRADNCLASVTLVDGVAAKTLENRE
jgi:uncharacterized protein (DUF1330 family)